MTRALEASFPGRRGQGHRIPCTARRASDSFAQALEYELCLSTKAIFLVKGFGGHGGMRVGGNKSEVLRFGIR